jgi:hypothetical protein
MTRSPAYVETVPYWADAASLLTFPTIDRDEDADVLVVGGGIAASFETVLPAPKAVR